MENNKRTIISYIVGSILFLILFLTIIDNFSIYRIKEDNLLKNNIEVINSNMAVKNQKDIKLINEYGKNSARVYLYQIGNKYAALGYAQSTLYKYYKINKEIYDLNLGENSYLYVQTPKRNYSFEISLKEGSESIKLGSSSRNNGRYYYFILTIGVMEIAHIYRKRKQKKKENESTY